MPVPFASLARRAVGAAALGATLAAGAAPAPGSVPDPIASVREVYDGTLTPDLAVSTFRHIDRLFPSRRIAPSPHPRPLPAAAQTLGNVHFRSRGRAWDFYDYLSVNRVAGLLVLKDGRIARELYQYGNTPRTHWMSMSIAKSITSTLIGVALHEGRIANLDEPITRYVTALKGSAYDDVSVRHLLTMTSGVRWNEAYTDPQSDRRHLLEAQLAQTPGAALALMASLPRAAPPGAVLNYSTGDTIVAGELVHRATGRLLSDYLSERIWTPVGMESDATWWLTAPGGPEVAGSGFSATLRDYARFGQYVLANGVIDGHETLPAGWVRDAGSSKTLNGGERVDYGYFWWPVTATPDAPDPGGAFYASGIFGQSIYVNQNERVVIVVWSAQSKPEGMDIIDDQDFYAAVVRALH
jgi:CubicO group peptidase (beta-lactamase class C family)